MRKLDPRLLYSKNKITVATLKDDNNLKHKSDNPTDDEDLIDKSNNPTDDKDDTIAALQDNNNLIDKSNNPTDDEDDTVAALKEDQQFDRQMAGT